MSLVPQNSFITIFISQPAEWPARRSVFCRGNKSNTRLVQGAFDRCASIIAAQFTANAAEWSG